MAESTDFHLSATHHVSAATECSRFYRRSVRKHTVVTALFILLQWNAGMICCLLKISVICRFSGLEKNNQISCFALSEFQYYDWMFLLYNSNVICSYVCVTALCCSNLCDSNDFKLNLEWCLCSLWISPVCTSRGRCWPQNLTYMLHHEFCRHRGLKMCMFWFIYCNWFDNYLLISKFILAPPNVGEFVCPDGFLIRSSL